jgi:iron complex outermembrane receptor protein
MLPTPPSRSESAVSARVPQVGKRFQVVASLAASLLGASVSAQGAEIEEVVVSATKRGEQALMHVPLAVSAFSGEQLERTGATRMSDSLLSAPGVTISDVNPGNQVIQIRGISSVFGDGTVGLYLDDVPFAAIVNLEMPQVPTFDLDRIEVLRGPQGTLYGASSQGGTVRVLTRDPDLSALGGKVDASYAFMEGGDPSRRIDAALNIPLIENVLGLRLTAGLNEIGGFIDDPSTGREDINDVSLKNYRAKLKYAPNDRLMMKVSAWRQDLDADGPTSADDHLRRPFGAIFPAAGLRKEFAEFSYDAYNFVIEYELPGMLIYSASSYLQFDERQIDLSTFVLDDRDISNFSQEVRLTSRSRGPLGWTLGAYYNDNETHFLFALNPFGVPDAIPGLPVNFVAVDQVDNSRSYAVFGEGTWSTLNDTLAITAGLRYFKDERRNLERSAYSIGFLDALALPNPRRAEFDTVQPKLNISYRPSGARHYYLNVARGFRSGLLQPAASLASGLVTPVPAIAPSEIQEESLWTYEVGAKLTTAGGRLSVDAAAYFNDWSDIQIFAAFPPLPDTLPIAFAYNGDTARAIGIDLALSVQVTDALELSLSGNVNESKYTADAMYVDPNGVVAPGLIRDGDPIVYVPEWTFGGTLTWRPKLPFLDAEGFVYLDVRHNAERHDPSIPAVSDANTFVNLRVGFERKRVGVYLFAENLLDESGSLFPVSPESAVVGSSFEPRPLPRTVGLNLKWHLD